MSLKHIGIAAALVGFVAVMVVLGYQIRHQPNLQTEHVLQATQGLVRNQLPFDAAVRFAPVEETTVRQLDPVTWEVRGNVSVIDPDGFLKRYLYTCRVALDGKSEFQSVSTNIDRLY